MNHRRVITLVLSAIAGCLIGAEPSSAPSSTSTVHEVYDPSATVAFRPQPEVVHTMVERGLRSLMGTASEEDGWRAWFKPSERIGIKVCSSPGPTSGTRPAVVRALVSSLLRAGHPASNIILWDRRMADLERAGYVALAAQLGIPVLSAESSGWNPEVYHEAAIMGRLVFGDLEFDRRLEAGVGRRSHMSRLITDHLDRIIVLSPVLNHNYLGINGQLANLGLGSMDNTLRFEQDPRLLAEVVPELCAMEPLISRYAFGVSDGLLCQYRGEERTLLHYAKALHVLRFSQDPVALDVLGLMDIQTARLENPTDGERPVRKDLYVNAELIELGMAQTNRIVRVTVP